MPKATASAKMIDDYCRIGCIYNKTQCIIWVNALRVFSLCLTGLSTFNLAQDLIKLLHSDDEDDDFADDDDDDEEQDGALRKSHDADELCVYSDEHIDTSHDYKQTLTKLMSQIYHKREILVSRAADSTTSNSVSQMLSSNGHNDNHSDAASESGSNRTHESGSTVMLLCAL